MNVVSFFSGIGGIELGLREHGFNASVFCEIDPIARQILGRSFPDAQMLDDILSIKRLPRCEMITAGFPCQDLSQAGGKTGIRGAKSSLVGKLFSLVEAVPARSRPEWILIENVPFMLRLDRGRAMHYLTERLALLGYRWAYRTVDARSFGLPQRRPRVCLLASRHGNPEHVLFADNYREPHLDGKPSSVNAKSWYGFYWTEGSRGIGWARDAVPPIKCGSTVGISSPPAVWIPSKDFVGTIDIRDAERLQGFPEHWTDFGINGVNAKQSLRWRLVGNAVSTKLSEWIGRRLLDNGVPAFSLVPLPKDKAWPSAACGREGKIYVADVSKWAGNTKSITLRRFLKHALKPLSIRATEGFLQRARTCTNVVYSEQFLASLRVHSRAQLE